MEILKGLRPYYESHHGLAITDEALLAAVKLSVRYLTDRFLPDKAIDLVDETAAFYKTIAWSHTQKSSLGTIERDLTDLGAQKREAVNVGDFRTAQKLKTKEQELLRHRHKMLERKTAPFNSRLKITEAHIADTVARITGIPSQNLLKRDTQKILTLERNLRRQVVGQASALQEISRSVRRSRAGIAARERPLGSFIFLGPSGVGKTLTAKILAQELFEDQNALLRIDMSEFMEKHNVARLIGAPAGYVGYEEGGRLTELIKRRPYAVVLFDEIEKAHPDVLNLLLQILEEGELTDAMGKKINFRNTLVILTSNIGLNSLNKWAQAFGFAEKGAKDSPEADGNLIKQQVLGKIREHFRPEFLNRIDKIIVFEPLQKSDIQNVVKLETKKLQERLLGEHRIKLKLSASVTAYLAEKSFDPAQGARLVRKNLQDLIEDQMAELILQGKIKTGDTATAKLQTPGKSLSRKVVSPEGKQKTIVITL